ncbi:MAG: tetratricopeptide repeat protein [Candidatus Sulfotelmatobacter sp.]|jgi:cytochrome c-type biogenesis protein CcmH/NrfG
MPNEIVEQATGGSNWQAKQVYAMAVISLVVGLAIGYLFRGSQSQAPAQPAANAQPTAPAGGMGGKMPSLEEMKQMAEKKAEPLLEKLKSDPNNKDLLVQVGNIYEATHRFKDAATFYGRALQVDPKNIVLRTQMASCLYYDGDVDGAITQLQQSLQDSPKDANSLFNLGMIKWRGKKDSKGAVAAWQQLLKLNPQLSPDRKAQVQKLMADAQMQGKS